MTTHPQPSRPKPPPTPPRPGALAELPTLKQVLDDAERLGVQMLAVLRREVDPTSEPKLLAWPEVSDAATVHKVLLLRARTYVERALTTLALVADLPVETTPAKGEEPAPGSAAALGRAARESTGAVVAPSAGADSGPSRGGHPAALPARGAGPGVLGGYCPGCPDGCCP